jgi:hypothetical protein
LSSPIRLAAALGAVACVGLLFAGLGASHRQGARVALADYSSLPAAPSPALKIGRPERLGPSRFLSRWTTVLRPAVARATPSADGPVLTELGPRTAERTPTALGVLRSRADSRGRVWVEVRLPILPNGSVGWLPRGALGAYQTVDTHLVVARRLLRATLYRAGKEVFTARVGVGTSSSPTPAGEFIVRNRLTRYASPFYGPVAFGTTARSEVLTDWPAGGFVGIHGTNVPQLLPGRVSHGCIRMRNSDILRLARLMPVGTPLTIR